MEKRIDLLPGFYLERVDDLYRLRGPAQVHEALLTEAEATHFANTIKCAREVSTMEGFLNATEALLENARTIGKSFPTLQAAAVKVRAAKGMLEQTLNLQDDRQEVTGSA